MPFLTSLLYEKPSFGLLSRYLIINCVTGAHSLFVFEQKTSLGRKKFFSDKSFEPKFERTDLQEYVYWFIDFAFKTVGMPVMT